MKFPSLPVSSLWLLGALALGGCSPQEPAGTATSTPPAAAAKRPVTMEAAAQGKGFAVGSLMSANTVYVFFDAQCPHCGHLWDAATPLHKKLKFVWVPVGLINASSTAQGAALLSAANPVALMSEHEASLLARKGGISAGSPAPESEQAIKANTELLNGFGAESVPFIVARNLKTGQTVTHEGAMLTPALAEFLGVDVP